MRRNIPLVLLLAGAIWLVAMAVGARPPGDGEPSPPDGQSADGNGLSLDPPQVGIGMFYGGATVTVTGEAPADSGVAVIVEGPREKLELKTQGKVGGVLWMSVGEVTFEQVPSLYLLSTSAPLAELASPEQRRASSVGYEALAARAGGDATLFGELVKLKEHEGLFATQAGALATRPDGPGRQSFTGSFALPTRLRAGEYNVTAVAFDQDGSHVLGRAVLGVELEGLARTMRSFALERGLLYGIGAVIAAILAGLLTGLIFGRKAGGGH